MALSKDTKFRLVHALGSQKAADEFEKRLISAAPSDASAAQAVLATMDLSEKTTKDLKARLMTALGGDGAWGSQPGDEINQKAEGIVAVLAGQANGSEVSAADATATLATTTPVIFTDAQNNGATKNGYTFTLTINAPAANADDTVVFTWGGPPNATTLAITPNDGTNNGTVPVEVTTAEMVEYINTGAIVGKNAFTAPGALPRFRQTATGGGAEEVADAGEGDGLVATFAGGASAADADTPAAQAALGTAPISAKARRSLQIALADDAAGAELAAAIDAAIDAAQDI